MVPGDRIVVVLLEPLSVGERFVDWPLHVTVVPWFRNDVAASTLQAGLTEALHAVTPFVARVGEAAYFGRKHEKAVELIELPSPLMTIERLTRQYLHNHDSWIADETTRAAHSYRPHITRQKDSQADAGHNIDVSQLAIVAQHGAYKEVHGIVLLGSVDE